jgi:hypothetical protein
MRRQILPVALLAFVVLVIGASSTLAAGSGKNFNYVFNGRLLADAGSSSTLAVHVNGGNKAAIKKLIGRSRDQMFAVDANTQYLRWTHGVPTVVSESNLVEGDKVTIQIKAPRPAPLADIEATPAWRVADRGPNRHYPLQPLWLFVGKLNAPASGGHVSLHITNGNLRALRAMLGQPLDQSFTYGNRTVFVLWHGKVPEVISPSQLVVGDKVSVRIRAPRFFSLAQVEQTPAKHVGDHEPGV